MTEAINQAPSLYALLIGIDCYMPNTLSNRSTYKNLGGCVRDVEHVEAFLKEMRQVPDSQILKLTSSINPDTPQQPVEELEKLPTYRNIVVNLKQLIAMTPTGAQVYIHYSGHGGRTKTAYPNVKGEDGIDEGLVPTDIGTPDGQYLRDLEIAKLLKDLVDKGLVVTMILDCCHSGGATRGDVEIRGIDVVDKTSRPTQSLVASAEELAATWRSLTGEGTRGLKSGWLPASRDYVVLAACRPTEFAYEYAFNQQTKERNGALTYWLLDTLRQQTIDLTYKDLHDRINAKVHSQFSQQTPMLIGEGNRLVFGSELATVQYAVPVLQVDLNSNPKRICIATGQAAGLRKGASFAIYSQGTTNFNQKEKRMALAEITELGATESWCTLTPIEGKPIDIKQGDQAVLVSASVNLVRKVALDKLSATELPLEILTKQDAALQAIADAIPGNGWVELATEAATDDEPVAYRIVLNAEGEYVICDRTGVPFANIHPPVHLGDFNAATTVVKRLVHLAKYHATQELDNFDQASPLVGKLAVEWLGKLEDYDPADSPPPKSKLKPFDDPSKPSVNEGEWIFLSIRNDYSKDLNIAVLDLESDWAISQIHPPQSGNYFITLSPGQTEIVPLQPVLEDGTDKVEDIVKVLATIGAANFRWLELPSLNQPLVTKSFSTRGSNPLDVLMSAINAEKPATRKLSPVACLSREWTVRQVTLTIAKA